MVIKNKLFYLLPLLMFHCGCFKSTVVSLFNQEQNYSPHAIDDDYFTLIVLPDTQKYSSSPIYIENFNKQTKWIVENKNKFNIKFVLHEGDIVDSSWVEKQWERASIALNVLDKNNIPYIITVGNHDLDGHSIFFKSRNKKMYDQYFPPSRYENESWYGGRMKENSNDNYWVEFESHGMEFLILSLEFGADDQVLQWAKTVVENHTKHRIIILTHCYMDIGYRKVSRLTLLNPHQFHLGQANDGKQLWDKFIKHHPNIFMVLSGHITGEGRTSEYGVNNNMVHQLLANYQAYTRGGNGWLRILRFVPSKNKIYIDTYTPLLDKWRYDKNGSFNLNYEMN